MRPQDLRDLIPGHIAYRHELNEAEQENILRGQHWALARKRDFSRNTRKTVVVSSGHRKGCGVFLSHGGAHPRPLRFSLKSS